MINLHPYLEVLPNILVAFIIGLLVTPLLRRIGLAHGFSTKPKQETDPSERGYITKNNTVTIPRLGEFAMLIPLGLLMWRGLNLEIQTFGIVIAVAMVAFLGAFDSKYNLSEFVKLYVMFFSSILLIFTGTVINIHSIIDLNEFDYFINNPLIDGQLSIMSALFTFFWIYLISTALSYVGGIDGLSEGTSAIAILILTLIGIRNGDTLTIVIGSLSLGGLLGLLPYNFYPANIYSEHLIYGFLIAILSIISKGKITTSILILTIPLIDFAYVTYRRLKRYFKENKKINLRLILHYMGTGDRSHLHHRMLELGYNHAKISLIQYTAYAALGMIALAVSGLYLTLAIIGIIAIIIVIFYFINLKLKTNG